MVPYFWWVLVPLATRLWGYFPGRTLRKVGVFVQLSGGTSGPDGLAAMAPVRAAPQALVLRRSPV